MSFTIGWKFSRCLPFVHQFESCLVVIQDCDLLHLLGNIEGKGLMPNVIQADRQLGYETTAYR